MNLKNIKNSWSSSNKDSNFRKRNWMSQCLPLKVIYDAIYSVWT